MHERIVQFSVSIADFVVVHEQFKSLSQSSLASVPFGQRRHDLGMINDEGGVEAFRFNEMTNKLYKLTKFKKLKMSKVLVFKYLVNQTGSASWCWA